MRLAWFRPAPAGPLFADQDTTALVEELGRRHLIDKFDGSNAHAFVPAHDRNPFDLVVYELADTPAHAFTWPYLLQYPGVLLLRARSLHDSRADVLQREGRFADYAAELSFSHHHSPLTFQRGAWPMVKIPVLASRLVVVTDACVATALGDACPAARVRYAPAGVPAPSPGTAAATTRTGRSHTRFALLTPERLPVVERAMQRAREAGAAAELVAGPAADSLDDADVVFALDWSGGPQTEALLGMAAAKAVIVLETEATAAWPALDPQTWQPRGLASDGMPIVVSADLRDEEHSLMLSIRRLSADAALRSELGRAASDWWRTHATVGHAAAAWQRILDEAVMLPPPGCPSGWPAHLTADGTERARCILAEFDLHVDLFPDRGR